MAQTLPKNPQKQVIAQMQDQLGKQDAKLKDNENLIKTFNIIVAATLIATLLTLVGLALTVYYNTRDKDTSSVELLKLQEQLLKEQYQTSLKLELLKAKNPYLK